MTTSIPRYHFSIHSFNLTKEEMNSSRIREVLNDYYSTDQLMPRIVKNWFIALYIGSSLLAIAVNLLIGSIIVRKRNLRNRTNLLIVNLMVADLLLAVICMPLTLMTFIRKSWPLGSVLCQIVPVGQGLPVFASSLTIAVIAIDRLLRVTSIVPRRRHSSNSTLVIEVFFIWTTSLLLSLPQGFSQKVIQVGIPGLHLYSKCIEDSTAIYMNNLYSILITTIQLLLPTISLTLSYSRIKQHLQTGLRRPTHDIHDHHDIVPPTILLHTTSFTSASDGDVSKAEGCVSSNLTQEQSPTAPKKVLQVSKNLKVCLKVSEQISSSSGSVAQEDKSVAHQEKSIHEEKSNSNEGRSVNEKETVGNEKLFANKKPVANEKETVGNEKLFANKKPTASKKPVANEKETVGNEKLFANKKPTASKKPVANEKETVTNKKPVVNEKERVTNEKERVTKEKERVVNEEKPSVTKRNRGVNGGNERSIPYELNPTVERRLRREMDRNKMITNTLFILTASFVVTWTPWNVISILVDFFPLIILPNQYFIEILATTHFLAMTSATLNPILYGYWNPSIRKELIRSRQGTSV